MAKKMGWKDAASADSPFAGLAALKADLPAGSTTPSAPPEAPVRSVSRPPSRAVVRLEKKGRGGKTVTRIEQLGLAAEALSAFATRLRRALGCGGGVEDDVVILQGDVRERAIAWLEAEGISRISR